MSHNLNQADQFAQQTDSEPLVKSVEVPVQPARAFALFTDGIGAWWPLVTHSVGLSEAVSVRIEAAVGGEIVETVADGRTAVWGTVTSWDPPHEIGFSWHPGGTPDRATSVTVTFTPSTAGTRVELTHAGWDELAHGTAMRTSYHDGWDIVLGCYTDLARTNG